MRYVSAVFVLFVFAGCGAGAPVDSQAVDREVIGANPNLPYSEAVRAGNTYYFSGKVGVTDETRALESGRAAAETHNIMEAFRETFDRLGLDFSDVVSGNVYLDDMADYAEMNEAYGAYFPEAAPARVTVGVDGLPLGAAVEISFVAVAR
jgi:2-iminobutanoate/2-iminopropanoate deaminase